MCHASFGGPRHEGIQKWHHKRHHFRNTLLTMILDFKKLIESVTRPDLVKRLDPDITDEDLELVVKKKRLQSRFWNRPVDKKVLDDQLEDLR